MFFVEATEYDGRVLHYATFRTEGEAYADAIESVKMDNPFTLRTGYVAEDGSVRITHVMLDQWSMWDRCPMCGDFPEYCQGHGMY